MEIGRSNSYHNDARNIKKTSAAVNDINGFSGVGVTNVGDGFYGVFFFIYEVHIVGTQIMKVTLELWRILKWR